MDLVKIGAFMKELRKEKNLTQEQLAEQFNVSRRTVSRWETGSNMPDLDILVEMADLYEVDLRELLNGERKNEIMEKELKETMIQVAEYTNAEKKRSTRVVLIYFVVGIIGLLTNIVVDFMELGDTFWTGFIKGSTIGMALGAMILGIIYATGKMEKIAAFKKRIIGKKEAL
ncbi:MAG: helix-turn-helix domain-containing protein [Eubacterium sp.]|nr:helix-turn-helix domain-containing protein [Eubacterium sp.]